jgi:hypothetical protein
MTEQFRPELFDDSDDVCPENKNQEMRGSLKMWGDQKDGDWNTETRDT